MLFLWLTVEVVFKQEIYVKSRHDKLLKKRTVWKKKEEVEKGGEKMSKNKTR